MGEPILAKELKMIQGESLEVLESRIHDLGESLSIHLSFGLLIEIPEHKAIVEGTNIAIDRIRATNHSANEH